MARKWRRAQEEETSKVSGEFGTRLHSLSRPGVRCSRLRISTCQVSRHRVDTAQEVEVKEGGVGASCRGLGILSPVQQEAQCSREAGKNKILPSFPFPFFEAGSPIAQVDLEE